MNLPSTDSEGVVEDHEDLSGVKHMDLEEFHKLGLLQEVNRRFFHPCGLALEMEYAEDGTMRFGGVWDYREDPEGIVFSEGTELSLQAVHNVNALLDSHLEGRLAMFGDTVIQPVNLPKR